MAEEQKTAPAANTNVEAEKDVQNVLAELKGDGDQAAPEKKDEAATGDAEEARIVAEAAKLGEKSEKSEEKTEPKKPESDTKPRGGRVNNRRNNAKFDPTTQKKTDNPVEIRKQVEFYFSDSNLPMDKFLLSNVGGSANRPVPISLIHSFKRMHRFQPFSAVVEALKSSETLELTDDDTCVRRKSPLPESVKDAHDPEVVKVFEDKAMNRSIYAKGFGEEQPSTQFDIEAFFAPYGPTNAIRLRRTYDKVFKGSVFVEFESEEKQKAFLALDPKPKWKGNDLLVKSKKDYCEEKVKEIEAGRVQPNRRGRGGFRGRGRGQDNRDWRDRRAEDQKKGFPETKKDSRGVPVVQSTTAEKEEPAKEGEAAAGQKRAHEEETPSANGEHPAKKVDVKEA